MTDPRKAKAACPMCGGTNERTFKYPRKKAHKGHQIGQLVICTHRAKACLRCRLPVALWPRVRKWRECYDRMERNSNQQLRDLGFTDEQIRIGKALGKRRRGGK